MAIGTAAFFISPSGKVIYTGTNHIGEVIKNPKKFGYTKEKLEKIYKDYNETYGIEGKAREKIIIDLINSGWIRIRKYKNFWSINVNSLSKRVKDYLFQWAKQMIEKGVDGKKADKYTYVKIDMPGKPVIQIDMNDLANDYLFSINEGKVEYPLIFLDSIDEMHDILIESTLSRIWQHIENNKNFGVISPFRGDLSNEENEERYKELKKEIRKMGYGFIELRGGYTEETGFVEEKSLFIPNIKKNTLVNLGKKYNQWSVIYKDKNVFVEIGTNNSPGNAIGKIHTNFISQSGSKNFTFDPDLFKSFFSSLSKGSHKGKKFLFTVYEMEEWSFNKSAYSKRGQKPQWQKIFEG